MSSVFNLAGWICFLFAAKNFLGIGASPDDMATAFLGELLPIPDVKTLLFAGAAAFLGYLAYTSGKDEPKKGKTVMLCAVICAVLTFTPLSKVSLFPAMMSYQSEQRAPDGYEPLAEGSYTLYAFLGSEDSMPSDVDVMRYIIDGYDGHAQDVYDTYKVTGWLYKGSGENLHQENAWYDVEVIFRLVDEDGNDILSDGEPVLLRYEQSSRMSSREQIKLTPEGSHSFQTNIVKAKDLSGTPYGFIVESVDKGYYIDLNDGSKHDAPIYN